MVTSFYHGEKNHYGFFTQVSNLILQSTGKKNPTMPVVVQLLNALKVSADAAFSDCVIGACETKSFLVQQKLSSLTKEEQFVILRLIDSSIESIRKAPSIFSGK